MEIVSGRRISAFLHVTVDLKTLGDRVRSRNYASRSSFIADAQLIFDNCRLFNPSDSDYYKCANVMENFFYNKLRDYGLFDK